MGKFRGYLRNTYVLGSFTLVLGTLLRILMARVTFLQADEEIFGYDAYYFLLGRSFEFIFGKIGAYIGYPFVLSIWYRTFGVSLLSARVFSVVCSAFFIFFIFLALRKITDSPRYAAAGTLLLAVLPFPLRYGHMVLSEPLAWVFLSLSFLLLVYAIKDRKWYLYSLSALLIAAAVFIRRSALIFPLIIVPFLIWTNRTSVKNMMRELFSWLGGFLIPLAVGVVSLILYFGWDRLVDLRWARIPHFSQEWQLELTRPSTIDDAVHTLQPVIWKALPLVIVVIVACLVIMMATHKRKWKPIYLGAVLWPALCAVAFHQEISSMAMARLMVIPSIVLFLNRDIKFDQRFYTALALLLGSSVAFSTVTIPGDLWNVMIYTLVGAMVLVYLEDRMDSRFMTPIFWLLGMLSLVLIMEREPRIEDLISVLAPVAGMVYCIGISISKEYPRNGHLILFGLLLPVLWSQGAGDPLHLLSYFFIASFSIIFILLLRKKNRWRSISFFVPLVGIAFALIIPDGTPFWGIYLPVTGTIIFMISGVIGGSLLRKLDHVMPLTGGIMALTVVLLDGGSFLLSLVAAGLVGSLSTTMRQLNSISTIWERKVPEKISILMVLLVIGYLAFYVYYGWTEVYLTEFLLQAAVLGGILIWVLRSRADIVKTVRKEGGRIKKTVTPVRIRRRVSVLFMVIVVLTIPVSIGAFLDDDWFRESSMDKRPYMRTIEEISDWIVDNTDDDEKVLAWHCYALQSDRETIIEVSNAAVYDARGVIDDMERFNVSVFVRCWYTDHGLWRNQPVFQDYIQSNFIIVRMVDGNECWKRI